MFTYTKKVGDKLVTTEIPIEVEARGAEAMDAYVDGDKAARAKQCAAYRAEDEARLKAIADRAAAELAAADAAPASESPARRKRDAASPSQE